MELKSLKEYLEHARAMMTNPEVENALFVNTNGGRSAHDNEYYDGLVPAFILPHDALVNPTPNANGSYTLLV